MKKKEKEKQKQKGSIRSPKDMGIALGTFSVALVVITLITTPVFTSVFPTVVASGLVGNDCCYGTNIVNIFTGDVCCEEIELLPPGSAIWLCQYIVYYESAAIIRINLNNEENWAEYEDLIVNLTGFESKEDWEAFCADMISRDPCVKEYILDQGFYVISCLDCECFWYLIDMADKCDCPVRIAMYDCCCTLCPVIPIFIY